MSSEPPFEQDIALGIRGALIELNASVFHIREDVATMVTLLGEDDGEDEE